MSMFAHVYWNKRQSKTLHSHNDSHTLKHSSLIYPDLFVDYMQVTYGT